MPDFTQVHSQGWLKYFADSGFPDVRPLAAGVEGAIYDLADGMVAKVWGQRQVAELQAMQKFYADVAAAGLPFRTPEILAVEQVDGQAVTRERKLPGQPLQARLSPGDCTPEPAATRCIIDVLRALAGVRATISMRRLAVLDEDHAFWAGADTFQTALLALLDRRVRRFGDVIGSRLRGFDRIYASLQDRLAVLAGPADTVIHGDLFAGNILAEENGHPLAVLDFGFLTTAGDPRFDAAVAANIMNMYAPDSQTIARELTARVAAELSYQPEVLLTYQAAYAVATSNAFTPDGTDGHFDWCIAQLRRDEVLTALGI
jgi:aminoglycoside phosphotransferase (APT) family kinase protein